MKLMGKDISADAVMEQIAARLSARGLTAPTVEPIRFDGLEPRVDPSAFNLEALAEHADPTRAMPLETHRGGAGRAVLAAKWAFRKTCQVFINEAFARQRVFNGHVRDSYAQLAAEVSRLRAELQTLQSPPPPAPVAPKAKKVKR